MTGQSTPRAVPEIPDLQIPAGTPQPALLAHARRLAEAHRVWSATRPPHGREQTAWGGVPALAHAVSLIVDLGMDGRSLTAAWRLIRPLHWHGTPTLKEVLTADLWVYDGPSTFARECPVGGPRGGQCRMAGARVVKAVTNPVTGQWAWRYVCTRHLATVHEAKQMAPDPEPNRGGVLLRVFPEVDVDALYRVADPSWTAWEGLPVPSGPLLRVATGDDLPTNEPPPPHERPTVPLWHEGRGRWMHRLPSTARGACGCCGRPRTHVGFNGTAALMSGCEWAVRRWVQDGIGVRS